MQPRAPTDEEITRSGTLGETGRRAAIGAAIALAGRYFASGNLQLHTSEAVGRQDRGDDPELTVLLAALRLRTSLAAATRLCGLLARITTRPSFRYRLRSVDSTGEVGGQLDVNRYASRLGTVGDVPEFPVIVTYRSESTPENVLGVYAAQWLLKEMRTSLRACGAPPGGPEYAAWTVADRQLRKLLDSPEFAACRADATAVRLRNAERRLVSTVRRRLQRREIASPTPYADLVQWVERVLDGDPIAEPGEIDWVFYGEQFDSKLFELWCLWQLGSELAVALNQPIPDVDARWRLGSPTFRFKGFFGEFQVHFQRRMGGSGPHTAQWRSPDGTPLYGTPDIVVQASPISGDPRTAVLDPKLKQRRNHSEDVYKILGYLTNFDLAPAVGFVLAHTTSRVAGPPNRYEDDHGGVVGIVELNPAAPHAVTSEVLRPVVHSVLAMAGQSPVPTPPNREMSGSLDPDDVAEKYASKVQNWLVEWANAHPREIGSVEDRLAAAVGAQRWKALDRDVQIMMATADHIGYNLTDGDFSGPVIGLCASIEHILHTRAIQPALDAAPAEKRAKWQNRTKMLGNAITALESSAGAGTDSLHQHLRHSLQARGADLTAIAHLVPRWRTLNQTYRIPAAHRALVGKHAWHQLYGMVVGAGTLFTETVDALVK